MLTIWIKWLRGCISSFSADISGPGARTSGHADHRGPGFCSLLGGAKSTCASFADVSSAGRGSRGYSYSSALASGSSAQSVPVVATLLVRRELH
jgi:hypothetical protein